MARVKKSAPAPKNYNVAEMQPDELNELKKVVVEYVERRGRIENEVETLKGDIKTLEEEYASKLDLKTLKQVERYFRIRQGIAHRDTFDLFCEVLENNV
jgi:uncharacterized protein (UPF0335 family)